MRVLRIVGSRGDHDLEDDMQRCLSRTAQLSWNTPLHIVSHIPRFAKTIHSSFLAKATFPSDTMSSYPTPGTCAISVLPNRPAHEVFRDAPVDSQGTTTIGAMPPFVRPPAQTWISRFLYSSSATLFFQHYAQLPCWLGGGRPGTSQHRRKRRIKLCLHDILVQQVTQH
jgi:hypothetical protein